MHYGADINVPMEKIFNPKAGGVIIQRLRRRNCTRERLYLKTLT
jgi:hypothetical protein